MRVLLATDGSDDAKKAVAYLDAFPLPPATSIRVLSVVTFPASALDIPPVRDFNQALLTAGRQSAEDAAYTLAHRLGGAEAHVMEGDPREVIVQVADDWRANLVVVGARGLGRMERLLLGSVSTAVVRHARCPVLVVRGTAGALRRAVVAIDGSADSLAAVGFLASLPFDGGLRVRLLGVVEPAPVIAPSLTVPFPVVLDHLLEERRARLEGTLSRVAGGFEGRVAAIESSVCAGDPAGEILAAAGEPGVDLVVVGARGRGRVARLVLGSVSERVVQHAPCPVLVVKTEIRDDRA
jgi:nucleotide-binding universal stress UspA family protein